MQNYWNLYLACKQQQLYGPVSYRDFRETGPWAAKNSCIELLTSYLYLKQEIDIDHVCERVKIILVWTKSPGSHPVQYHPPPPPYPHNSQQQLPPLQLNGPPFMLTSWTIDHSQKDDSWKAYHCWSWLHQVMWIFWMGPKITAGVWVTRAKKEYPRFME